MESRLSFVEDGALRPARLVAYYRDILERPPFCDPKTGLWVVGRHQDVREVLIRPADYANSLTLVPHYPVCAEAMDLLMTLDAPGTTAGGDGDGHRRGRRTITATFPITAEKVEAQVGELVRSRIDRLIAGFPSVAVPGPRAAPGDLDELDLIASYAWELPLQVICELIGIPADRYDDVKSWSDGQIALVWGSLPDADQVRCARGLLNLWELCQDLVAERKEAGDDHAGDLVGRLVAYQRQADDALTDREAASILLNLAVAGHETTANAIGNSLYHLLSNPNLWNQLVARPQDGPAVAEELLRLHPPIVGWSRVTTRDVKIGGASIPANHRVLLLLGAANRDPHAFRDPHQVRPGRTESHAHLTFGLGLHYCVGAALARLELTESLRALTRAHPELTLRPGFDDTTVTFKANIGFRALTELPVLGRFGAETF